MPISSASAIPSANERTIDTAAMNFAVGMIVIRGDHPEKGGTMVDSLARPTISQTTNQSPVRKGSEFFCRTESYQIHQTMEMEYWQ